MTKKTAATNAKSANNNEAANSYDQIPYTSYPYPGAQPERLYTIGKLFGIQPVDFKKCKVLELGCASGGNIIPCATFYPDSQFVGVDLSEVQVKAGQEQIEALGLKNIELKTMSIADINAKFGKFDYIIIHGVFSWVPKDIQDKILEICSKNLTKNGVAYISYNTLPGWNAIKSIREMMLYHTKDIQDPKEKIVQARLLLEFLKDANAEGTSSESAYAKIIAEEINNLRAADDSYLVHDFLDSDNTPFYFHQVVTKASENGLQYLGDSALSAMNPANIPQKTAEALAAASDDIVRFEQYMDFIRNRRFRTSLFCHQGIEINRNIKPELFEDFYVSAQFVPTEDFSNVDLTKRNEVAIQFTNGLTLTTANPHVINSLAIIQKKQGKPVAVKELLNNVLDIAGKSADAATIRTIVLENLVRLAFNDAVGLYSSEGNFVTEVTEKPKASALARIQAAKSNWITNQKTERADIDLFNRVLIQYLDGNNDFETILDNMVKHFENDELSLNVDDKKLSDKKQLKEVLTEATKRNIENLAPMAILVA